MKSQRLSESRPRATFSGGLATSWPPKRHSFLLLMPSLLVLLSFVLTNATASDAATELIINSIGMKLAIIPAGEFTMGSPESEAGRHKDEPQHRVRIARPYYIGIYEVRRQDFERFVEAEDYRTDAERDERGGWGWNRDEKRFGQKAGFTWQSWGVDESPSWPAVNVSWNDAAAFCKWLRG